MPPPDIRLTYRDGGTGDAGDPYTGLDRFGRLVETLWKPPGTGDPRVQSKYGRNKVGGVVWRKDEQAHAQGVSTEDNYYWYDALQQVKERQRGDLTGPAPDYTGVTNLQQKEDWTHDATGNWAAYSNTSPTNGQTRTHNTANEITEISSSPGDVTPAYDPVGNMLTLPKAAGTSTDQYDLVWDAWNRLVAVKDGSTVVASYTYDGLTRRQTKTNAAETRHYYYNAAWRALEERVEGASSEIDRQFTWSLRDRWDLLRRKRSVTGSLDEVLYVLRDYLDPVAIVDETGAVVERYAYDAFGNVRFLAPDYSSRTGSDFDWDFLFHAEFRDPDTQFYNYGFRYYDCGLGRWLSRDPVGGDERGNNYAILRNDTIDAIDLVGLFDPVSSNWSNASFLFGRNFNPNSLEIPVPGFAPAKVPGADAITLMNWTVAPRCVCNQSTKKWELKAIHVTFWTTIKMKPNASDFAAFQELDHAWDFYEWASTKGKETLAKVANDLSPLMSGMKTYNTRTECEDAAGKAANHALSLSAFDALRKSKSKYDAVLKGHRPHSPFDPKHPTYPAEDFFNFIKQVWKLTLRL